MGYNVYLFRKEVQKNNNGFDFLENEKLVMPFTEEQFHQLKTRLLDYGYEIESESEDSITFNFEDGAYGINARLTKRQLSFSGGSDEDGIFEILQTASEFTDTGEFRKLDPQRGEWEEFE